MSRSDATGANHSADALTSADFPDLQQAANRASGSGQRWHLSLAGVELAGVVSAAVFGAAGLISTGATRSSVAVLTVLALLTAMLANLLSQQRRHDKDWFDGRAVAESVKTSSWRYMMHVPPYDDDATCNRIFVQQLVAILNARSEVRHELGGAGATRNQITARMRQIRGLNLEERIAWYLDHRLLNQVEWYSSKAAASRVAAQRWFWASIATQLAALVAAIIAVTVSYSFDIVSVLAATSAAFTAWTNLRRHEDLSKTYSVAAQELLALSDLIEDVASERDFTDIVVESETAISREHTMWVAKRGEPLTV